MALGGVALPKNPAMSADCMYLQPDVALHSSQNKFTNANGIGYWLIVLQLT